MQQLAQDDQFAPPSMASIETVLEEGLRMDRGRVFMDLWDLERFADCDACADDRRDRLHRMNLTQTVQPPVACDCG
jgi:hypothetical protein